MQPASHRIVEALGVADKVDANALADRRASYACAHLGMCDLRIGALLDLLGERDGGGPDGVRLCPPRTGHLGNWQAIAHGQSGALDFNQTICTGSFGHPLIYCFTQTEAESSDAQHRAGDWVYMPGSIVDDGTLRTLPLYTWDGSAFARRARTTPLFCPFVQTEDPSATGGLVALTTLHRRRMNQIAGFEFRVEAEMVTGRQDEVREIMLVLLEAAGRSTNPRRAMQDLISHAASLDGTMTRCELQRDGVGYRLDDTRYATTDDLIDHVLLTFSAVTSPDAFFDRVGDLPAKLPVMSNLLAGILSAIFAAHFPDACRAERARLTRPFNAHLHWGARDMAGYPPRRNGYFVERSTTRSLRAICTVLVASLQHVDPVCMVIMPAAIFMLCPTTAHPNDSDLLDELFHTLVSQGAGVAQTESLTAAWLERRGGALSAYFLSRFRHRSGVLPLATGAPPGAPVVPDRFRALSVRQACAAVGVLVDAVSNDATPWA